MSRKLVAQSIAEVRVEELFSDVVSLCSIMKTVGVSIDLVRGAVKRGLVFEVLLDRDPVGSLSCKACWSTL